MKRRLLLLGGIIGIAAVLCACGWRHTGEEGSGTGRNTVFHLDNSVSIVLRNGNTGGEIAIADEEFSEYIYDTMETLSLTYAGKVDAIGWTYLLQFEDDQQRSVAEIFVNRKEAIEYDGKQYSCDCAELYGKLEAYWDENAKKSLFDADRVCEITMQSSDAETSRSVTDMAVIQSVCDKIDQESLISGDAVYGNGRPYTLTLLDGNNRELAAIVVNANVELACNGRIYCCKDLGLYDYLEEYWKERGT